ncbi:hypothetical protein HPB50_008228 [Hyalomma asiaticum]|uniref:Uncharacterized protein n=1 Tax=Hyalomma asiaticum TaxID=266040 RepID=A0ACB7SFU3_HYAAI|nr:hypothetical protein HPB50_008228 [Hyalomma asiaticum]
MDLFKCQRVMVINEMRLSEHLPVDTADKVSAFVDLRTYTHKEETQLPCDHGLVVMFVPLTGSPILGTFATRTNIKGELLAKIVLEATISAEKAGLFVNYVTCDATTWNRKMWRMMGLKANSKEAIAKRVHPSDDKRSLYFLSDFPHLVKNIGNRLLQTSFHMPDGKDAATAAAWEALEEAGIVPENVALSDFVNADTDVIVYEELSDAEILKSACAATAAADSSDDEEVGHDVPKVPTPVTASQVMDSLETIRSFLGTHDDDLAMQLLTEFAEPSTSLAAKDRQKRRAKLVDTSWRQASGAGILPEEWDLFTERSQEPSVRRALEGSQLQPSLLRQSIQAGRTSDASGVNIGRLSDAIHGNSCGAPDATDGNSSRTARRALSSTSRIPAINQRRFLIGGFDLLADARGQKGL